MRKRGIMGLSFGIIFSIFLIIIFIFFAFKAITAFTDLNKCVEIGSFYDDFQEAIDNARESQETLQPFNLNLGQTVDKICFVDLNSTQRGSIPLPDSWAAGDNFFIMFHEGGCEQVGNNQFENLNITKITEILNPYCFENGEEIKIKKTIYSRLVTLE